MDLCEKSITALTKEKGSGEDLNPRAPSQHIDSDSAGHINAIIGKGKVGIDRARARGQVAVAVLPNKNDVTNTQCHRQGFGGSLRGILGCQAQGWQVEGSSLGIP